MGLRVRVEQTGSGGGGGGHWSLTKMSLLHFSNFLNIHPITMAYNLKSTTQAHLTSLGMRLRWPGGGEVAPGEGRWPRAVSVSSSLLFKKEETT